MTITNRPCMFLADFSDFIEMVKSLEILVN